MDPVSTRTRILIVDDQPDMLELLRERLQSWGYNVLMTSSGEVGLVLARKHQPALILLDVLLPDLGGHDVCALLKENPDTQEIPVIVLSVVRTPQLVERAFQVGAEDYILKPFEANYLKNRIAACLLGGDAAQPTEGQP